MSHILMRGRLPLPKVVVTIDGKPVAKERPRKSRSGVIYTPAKTQKYEKRVKECYRAQSGFRFDDGVPIDSRIYVYFQIPKSTSKKNRAKMLSGEIRPTKRPDYDNLGKTISDALNGVAYKDDAQIVDAQVRKFYGDRWKIVVVLQEVNNGQQQSGD